MLLDERHAGVEIGDQYGFTALHYSVLGEQLDMVKMLVEEHHANPNLRYLHIGPLPVHLAIAQGNFEIIEYLLDFINFVQNGATANDLIHCAVSTGHLELARMMVNRYNFRTDGKNTAGFTLLHAAISCPRKDMVPEILGWLVKDCGLRVRTQKEETEFFECISTYANRSVVEKLIELCWELPGEFLVSPSAHD